MAELTVPQIDFSSLGQLPAIYQKAQADELRKQTLANLGQGGTADAAALMKSGDMSLAQLGINMQNRREDQSRQSARDAIGDQRWKQEYDLKVKSLNMREPNELDRRARAGGLAPGTPAYQEFMLRGGRNSDVTPSVTEKKEIFKSEDELPNLQGTVEGLNRALEMNDNTFTGYTAGTRAAIGSRVPGGGYLVDKAAADATTEWQNTMSQEAITTMADSLKGATTDFELNTFKKDLADPTTPPAIRKRIITRMLTLAERQKAIKERRIKELPGGSYFKPQGSKPQGTITQQQYEALPSGSTFTAPDGSQRIKP